MRLRPAEPILSLKTPASITETPPQSGKRALLLAACALLSPTTCVKYVGVHRLKVSRNSVVPSDNIQTNQKLGERINGLNISNSPRLSIGTAPAKRFRGFSCGAGSPSASEDSLRKNRLSTKIIRSNPAPAPKIPRH